MTEFKGRGREGMSFVWILQISGVKQLCDYGSCQKGSMVRCTECNSILCLDHQKPHLETCGMPDALRYEVENGEA